MFEMISMSQIVFLIFRFFSIFQHTTTTETAICRITEVVDLFLKLELVDMEVEILLGMKIRIGVPLKYHSIPTKQSHQQSNQNLN